MLVTLLYGAGAAVVLLLSLATRKRLANADAVLMAGYLCAVWGLSRIGMSVFGYWQTVELYPFSDLAGVFLCAWAYSQRGGWWKLALCALLALKLYAHAAFWTLQPLRALWYQYVVLLNVLYVLELLLVASAGGTLIARDLGSWLLPDRSRHSRAGAAARRESAPPEAAEVE